MPVDLTWTASLHFIFSCIIVFTLLSQISSHVKAIDAIYQGTDFMGIRNISFMVKRIRVSLLMISFLKEMSSAFLLNWASSFCTDKHHQWWEGQVQPVPLCKHRSGEVLGAELGAEPRWLLFGLRFHWQRLWWRRVGFGLGGSPLRYCRTVSLSPVNSNRPYSKLIFSL